MSTIDPHTLSSTWLDVVTKAQQKATVPTLNPGDQVRVWSRILERDRIRLAPFEGVVIRRRGSGLSATVTVRRVTYGEGVERIFPLHAPVLERIEVLRRAKVRRARLYFLRAKVGKVRIEAADQGASGESSARERTTQLERSEERTPEGPQSHAHISAPDSQQPEEKAATT